MAKSAFEKWWLYKPRLSETGEKVRNVVCLIYLEDLEKVGKTYFDLLGYLDHIHVVAVCSPLHDRDTFSPEDVRDWCLRHIDSETGDLDTHYLDSAPYVGKAKKPHVHVGIMLPSQKNAQQFSELMAGLLPIRPSMWEKMEDKRGFIRYLAHLDSPQKAQYSAFDIHGFGGVDLSCLLKTDEHEKVKIVTELHKFGKERKVQYFHQFVDDVFASGDMDYINCILGRGSFFAGYYNSIVSARRIKLMSESNTK